VLHKNKPPKAALQDLMARKLKSEFRQKKEKKK
jgi:hypothetical protein